jgi:hypothetical protein
MLEINDTLFQHVRLAAAAKWRCGNNYEGLLVVRNCDYRTIAIVGYVIMQSYITQISDIDFMAQTCSLSCLQKPST